MTGRISDDSDIGLWGENMPRPVTSGWETNSSISSQSKIEEIVIFDVDLRSHLYDDGELNVLVTYLDRKWTGNKITEEEKEAPAGTVTINGGNLSLHLDGLVFGDKQDKEIAIIGRGFRGEKNGTLNIDSSLSVWFEGKDPVARDKRISTCQSFSDQWLHIGAR